MAAISLLLLSPAVRTSVSAAPEEAGRTYALIVNGISKDPKDALVRDRIVEQMRRYLLGQAAVDPSRLVVLDGRENQATAEAVTEAMNTFASTARRRDRFVLYYAGQANAVAQTLRLNLPGPDVTGTDIARLLDQIKTKSHLIVLDCPCAALAAKALTGPGRVVVCASTEAQAYSTRFGLHFVPALARPETDADGDGKVSVLEAFTAAAREIEQWYRDRGVLATETPCLDDNGDGIASVRPWRYAVEATDGLAASRLVLATD